MGRIFIISIFLVPFFSAAQQTDSLEVDRLNKDWIASYAKKDTSAMNRILAEDFRMISSNWKILSKRDLIKNIGNPENQTIATIDSCSIRIFGSTALVVGFISFTSKTKTESAKGRNVYSDLYVKRVGRWTAVSAQVTRLE
ncbi:MAG TPA: nuclear transport factor 2 family protein [Flavitalea sp.]|nr:nuclear transport factor 2 family protein [Flavitalea sp.]